MSAFQKNTGVGGGAAAPRRKWQPPSKTASQAGGSPASSGTPFSVQLKKTPSKGSSSTASGPKYGGLNKIPTRTSSEPQQPVPEVQKEEPSNDISTSDSTISTADMTTSTTDSSSNPELSSAINDEKNSEVQDDAVQDNNKNDKKIKKKSSSGNKKSSSSKSKSSGGNAKKKNSKSYYNPFALDEADLKKSAKKKRTKGTFDWSGVDSVIKNIIPNAQAIQSEKEKLQEKYNTIDATRREALKTMQKHVEEQKNKMDDKRDKIRHALKQACKGMTYDEMVEKVKENHQIVASLKKSNQKLRNEGTKLTGQIKNLRVNNMKLEAANEQSTVVLDQLKERKTSVDSRYEHLTKVIIPPYQERIKELEEVVEERKLYGINENRTKIRYGNYIIRFLDKVDRSEESMFFKEEIFEMGMHVEGGHLPDDWGNDDDSDDSDNKIVLEELDNSLVLDDMPSVAGLGATTTAATTNNSTTSPSNSNSNSANLQTSQSHLRPEQSKIVAKEEKSLWDRYGGGASQSKLSTSSSNLGGSSGGGGGAFGKHADILQKVNREQAANFNGAVILSDSDSDDDDDSDDDISVSSDDS